MSFGRFAGWWPSAFLWFFLHMARHSPASPDTEAEPSFEQAMEELEAIVQLLESERLPLKDLVERYERGMKLLRVCQERLDHAQRSISLITAGADNRVTAVPFQGNAASSPSPASPSVSKPSSSPAAPPADDDSPDNEIRLF